MDISIAKWVSKPVDRKLCIWKIFLAESEIELLISFHVYCHHNEEGTLR